MIASLVLATAAAGCASSSGTTGAQPDPGESLVLSASVGASASHAMRRTTGARVCWVSRSQWHAHGNDVLSTNEHCEPEGGAEPRSRALLVRLPRAAGGVLVVSPASCARFTPLVRSGGQRWTTATHACADGSRGRALAAVALPATRRSELRGIGPERLDLRRHRCMGDGECFTDVDRAGSPVPPR